MDLSAHFHLSAVLLSFWMHGVHAARVERSDRHQLTQPARIGGFPVDPLKNA
jgi:hypothetical protein